MIEIRRRKVTWSGIFLGVLYALGAIAVVVIPILDLFFGIRVDTRFFWVWIGLVLLAMTLWCQEDPSCVSRLYRSLRDITWFQVKNFIALVIAIPMRFIWDVVKWPLWLLITACTTLYSLTGALFLVLIWMPIILLVVTILVLESEYRRWSIGGVSILAMVFGVWPDLWVPFLVAVTTVLCSVALCLMVVFELLEDPDAPPEWYEFSAKLFEVFLRIFDSLVNKRSLRVA